MRNYILIIPLFLVSLIVISYYVFRNSEISKTTREFTNIQQLAYELEILTQKQKRVLDSLHTQVNYDEIVKISGEFQMTLEYYIEELKILNDPHLNKIIKNIEKKNRNLLYIYEDIKTDNAVIKNSFLWLSKSYKIYLLRVEPQNINREFMEYIFDVMKSKDDNRLIEVRYIDESIFKDNKLNLHIQTIYNKQTTLIQLQKELLENDLVIDIDNIILYTLKSLSSLQKETALIIKLLLISSLFLLLFGLLIYAKEVMSRREAQRLKNELQQFVDALNESAIVSKTDLKGNITYVNDKFCTLSGYTKEELIGQGHNIVRHPDMPSEIFKTLWKTIQEKRIFKATIKNRKKDGSGYYVDSVVLPIFDVNGEVEEYLAVRYDVTELINSRDKAIIAEKAKDEFLSNMSHELRTPLNSINGFSSILKRLIKDEKHLKYLQNIIDSSDTLIGLINDILDLSKLQSGKFSLDYHDFALEDKMNHFLNHFDAQLLKSSLTMNKNIDKSINVTLNGDWLRISQIITNLISNAIKFSPKDNSIEFDAKYEESQLIIKVSDNGIGMSKEAQDKIFKPFEQADSSTTREYGGTGLGLSIVLSLVSQMKGKINLDSNEGVGSSFEVIIPLQISKRTEVSSTAEDKIKIAQESDRELLKGHILIAEDNKTNQMLIGILMQEFGLSYTLANDGVEAVDKFSKEKFDLVLMDENMPNLNGCDAMRRIHELHGDLTPVIALTANAMSGDKERFLKAGMRGYVSKPIDDDELYRVIQSLLKK